MNPTLFFALVFSALLGRALAGQGGWTLKFEDNFDGNTIDTSKWNVANDHFHKGNKELSVYLADEVYVQNGNLVIRSQKRQYGKYAYTSGWVDTKGLFIQEHGKFEIRAKLPKGKGLWPAHWMLPQWRTCWPVEGELDIMEYLGQDPGVLGDVHATVHWGPGCNQNVESTSQYGAAQGIDFTSDFHVFSMIWDPHVIKFYVDGHMYHSVPASKFSPDRHFYLILNTAVGGTWPGSPDAKTVFPQYHLIDYVRVWHNDSLIEAMESAVTTGPQATR